MVASFVLPMPKVVAAQIEVFHQIAPIPVTILLSHPSGPLYALTSSKALNEVSGMGKHAFRSAPEHSRAYGIMSEPPLPRLFGLNSNWNMPVVRHRAVLGPDAVFPGVPHYVLTYHISGAPVRRLDRPDLQTVARTGSVSLQLPGSGGQFVSDHERPVEYAHFYFQNAMIDELLADADFSGLGPPRDDFFGIVDTCWQRDLVSYLDRARDTKCPPTTHEMDDRAKLVIMGLIRVAQAVQPCAGNDQPALLTEDQLFNLKEFVKARLAERVRLAEMAAHVSLSQYHFSRRFKRTTGETPGEFLMRLRLEQTVKLLRETNLPIAEIAYRTGFSSQSHVTRRVKKAFGMTPTEIRRATTAPDTVE